MDEGLSKRPKRDDLHDVVQSRTSPVELSEAAERGLSAGLLPGWDCCVGCAAVRELCACPVCERVTLCRDCIGLPHAECSLLRTIRAVEEDRSGSPRFDEDMANAVLSRGWSAVVASAGAGPRQPAAAVWRFWQQSEALAAPLAVWNVLRKKEALSVLQQMRRGGQAVVHLVGIEDELALEPAGPWRWMWHQVAKLSVHVVGIGPQAVAPADAAAPMFQVHAEPYEAFCARSDGAAPALVVLVNPGLTVAEYSWAEALAVFRGRWPRAPLLSLVHSLEESMRDEGGSLAVLLFSPHISVLRKEVLMTHGLHLVLRTQATPDWASLRWHQSGTVASDVYVKAQWATLYK